MARRGDGITSRASWGTRCSGEGRERGEAFPASGGCSATAGIARLWFIDRTIAEVAMTPVALYITPNYIASVRGGKTRDCFGGTVRFIGVDALPFDMNTCACLIAIRRSRRCSMRCGTRSGC